MALTPSNMLPLGTRAPEFNLPDTVSGKSIRLSELPSSRGLVVMFLCNHCPYVKHVQHTLAALAKTYSPRGISWIAISSNDVANYPADSPEAMSREAKSAGYIFPYLYDESQSVARVYQAACTPDLYLFDANRLLVYRGQLDGSRPGNGQPVTGSDLRAAMEALLSGSPIASQQKPSIGCNIKWKHS